jgi:hypothetical protein
MNIAERRRAEGLIDEWRSRRVSEITAAEHVAIAAIPELPRVRTARQKIGQEIARLQELGYSFSYHEQSSTPIRVTRSASHPSVRDRQDQASSRRVDVTVLARSYVTRVWSDDLDFEALAKLIA